MALGSLLLQPKTLERMQTLDANQALADGIVALLHQIVVNPDHLDSIAPAFRNAFAAMAERMRVRLEPRLQGALDQLRDLLAPVLQAGQDIAAKGQRLDSAGEVFELIAALLEKAVDAAQALSEPQLRDLARRLNSILTDTMGLNQTLLKDELREVFKAVRQELLQDVATVSPRSAGIHLALASLIGRMEQEVFDEWPELDLNPDRLAQALMQGLRDIGFEKLRAQLACILEKVRAALAAGGALIDLAKPGAFAGSVGAQARAPLSGDTYCWYASWLYATRRQSSGYQLVPFYPSDEVWLSEDRKQLILRRASGPDEVLHEVASGTMNWYDAPQFSSASRNECFAFGAVGPKFLEVWTQLFAALTEGGKSIGHIVSCATSPQEYASNIPFIVWDLTKTGSICFAKAPLPSFISHKAGSGVGASQVLFNALPIVMWLAGSFEGIHSKATGKNIFWQWVTLLGSDALSAFTIHSLATAISDGTISFWTLINQKGPAGAPSGEDTRPRNREYDGLWTGLAGFLSGWIFCKYIISREDYAHPGQDGNVGKFLLFLLLGAPLAGVTGGLVGTLLGWACSRTYDWGQFGKNIGLGALKSFLMFVVQEYTTKEGDTDDGKYNPKLDPNGNPYAPARQPFNGYPPQETSPYELPYEKGVSLFVGQANQGMFSHMRFNWLPQIYAYDFAHDFGDEILASRGGTVVDYFDWIPDTKEGTDQEVEDAITAAGADLIANQSGSLGSAGNRGFNWNFIMIRHDTQATDHDKDAGGGVVTTFGVYGHGKQGSVRAVFAARGVTDPKNIIGTVVQKGQVIMLADDTGTSFHNHLHMHVQGATSSTPASPPIRSSQLTQYTLPFVFREAGRLKNLNWYKSDNEKV